MPAKRQSLSDDAYWVDATPDLVAKEQSLSPITGTQVFMRQKAVDQQKLVASLQQQMAQASGAWACNAGVTVPTTPTPKYEGAYNKDTPCKACGEKGPHQSKFVAEIVRHKKEYPSGPSAPVGVDYEDTDKSFIRRTCTNCGHYWHEAPIYLIPALVAERMLGGGEQNA